MPLSSLTPTFSVAMSGLGPSRLPTWSFCFAVAPVGGRFTSTVPLGIRRWQFVCVDGLQRLTAIRRFLQNEIPVFGSKYSEYTDSLRSSTTVRVHVNDLKSREEVLRWYLEMNAGGTPHSKKEIQRVKDLLDAEVNK